MSTFQSEQIGELAKALAAAQGAMDAARKDSKGNYGKYTTISSILEVVKDALSANSLAVTQSLMPSELGFITLRTTLMHASGQWIAGELTMKAEAPGPQKIGSVITYARRYALAAMLGVGQEDDDAQAAQDYAERKQPRAAAAKTADAPQQAAQARKKPSHPAEPVQMPSEIAAKAKEVWEALGAAGFQSREDRLHEIGRILGKPVQGSKELTLDDCSAVLRSLNSANPDNPFD